jgi:hypothetical protein
MLGKNNSISRKRRDSIESALAFLVVSAVIAITLIAILSPVAIVSAATINTVNEITSEVQVSGVCIPTISNSVIAFAQGPGVNYVQSGFYAPTANAELVGNSGSGSVAANILIYSRSGPASNGNWIDGGVGNFLVGNTLWDLKSDTANNGNQLTTSFTIGSAADTQVTLSVGSSQDVYFGLNVPVGQPAGTYTQGITISMSC